MSRMRVSLRRRMTLAAAAAVAAAIAAAAGLTYVLVRAELYGEIDDSLRSTASELSGDQVVEFRVRRDPSMAPRDARRERDRHTELEITPPPDPPGRARRRVVVPREPELLPATRAKHKLVLPAPPLGGSVRYAQLVQDDGKVVRPPRSRLELPGQQRAAELAEAGTGSFFTQGEVSDVRVRVFTKALGEGAALQVARPLDQVEDTLSRLATILGLVTLGGVGLGAALALVVTRTTLKPVADLNAAAQHVARTRDLSRRIDAVSPDELGGLARSFNTMLEALEHSMRQQRQLVADASHELRTPLTSLRTNIEVLARSDVMPAGERQRLLHDVVAQLEDLSVLVGDLVDLAREDEPEPFVEDVRLDRLVEGVVERARRQHPERDFVVESEPTIVSAIPPRLDRAIANLVDNAQKWSPPGAPVELRLADGTLTVRDRGPGIDPADLPFVFDRFYRAPAARSMPGSGLGLAIAKRVADTHGGEISASTADGGGTIFALRLPAARPVDSALA